MSFHWLCIIHKTYYKTITNCSNNRMHQFFLIYSDDEIDNIMKNFLCVETRLWMFDEINTINDCHTPDGSVVETQ